MHYLLISNGYDYNTSLGLTNKFNALRNRDTVQSEAIISSNGVFNNVHNL